MKRQVILRRESWPIRGVFRISRGSRRVVDALVVEIRERGARGRGECIAYPRYGETMEGVMATIEGIVPDLESGLDRNELAARLPPGAARNAIDCALWDLTAKRLGRPAWELAGLTKPHPLITAFTLSIDMPDNMAAAARRNAMRPLLKLKLAGGKDDLARVSAVRSQAPKARLIVDTNEAWSQRDYETLVPQLTRLGVEMIEQPFKAGQDAMLAELPRPIPICADESCHDTQTLQNLKGLYDVINIKLDKTGGLSEALKLKTTAQQKGFEIMVGCMVATSLAMAPATLVAQGARYVDLDGPLLLARDREPGLVFKESLLYPPESLLWG
jgi:L-alanine-DL-glutamate epimerase-like enolase superfamily enzyme